MITRFDTAPPPSRTSGADTRADRDRLNLTWLIQLRYGAAAGHIGAILTAELLLDAELRLAPLLSIISLALATNVVLHLYRGRTARVPNSVIGSVMMADVLMLTALLYLSGGADNPGIVFYLLHVGLATVVLPFRWRMAVTVQAMLSIAALFVVPGPGIGGRLRAELPETGGIYELGLLASLTIAAGFIFHFGDRLMRALSRREAALARAKEQAMRDEKLASLANLAAGAAHELSTPLTTIAMLAKELEWGLETGKVTSEEAAEDALVIREEVRRCRDVLSMMAANSGESRGEAFEDVPAMLLLDEALKDLPRNRIKVEIADESPSVHVPLRPMALALRGIVKNALQASPDHLEVTIRTEPLDEGCRIVISDQGEGMAEDVAQRATEPFFTTKPTGEGMGLGLFLAYDLARRIGGRLSIDSEPGFGTQVMLTLPASLERTPDVALA